MHYRPFSEEDITRHVKRAHIQHKKLMANFQSFWDDLDEITKSPTQEPID